MYSWIPSSTLSSCLSFSPISHQCLISKSHPCAFMHKTHSQWHIHMWYYQEPRTHVLYQCQVPVCDLAQLGHRQRMCKTRTAEGCEHCLYKVMVTPCKQETWDRIRRSHNTESPRCFREDPHTFTRLSILLYPVFSTKSAVIRLA